MRRCTAVTVFVLFSLIGYSQGRVNLEILRDSWDEVEPFPSSDGDDADGSQAPEPVARLEGLQVRDGEMSPAFDPNTLNYSVRLSPGVTAVQIMAQVSLGAENEKYKVKTKSNILGPQLVNSTSHLSRNTSIALVEVKVSAKKHQSVTYYLEVGQALQERSQLWAIMFQVLFWGGILVATAVVGIFVYSIYLALSGGGVTGEGVQGYLTRGGDGEFIAVQDPEREGNGTS